MDSAQEYWFQDGAYVVFSRLTTLKKAYTSIGRPKAYNLKKTLRGRMQISGGSSALILAIGPERKLQVPRMASSSRLRKPAIAISARQQQRSSFGEHLRYTTSSYSTEKPGQGESAIGCRKTPRCC